MKNHTPETLKKQAFTIKKNLAVSSYLNYNNQNL
jgi:hypothetical protein